jgi:phage-related protein
MAIVGEANVIVRAITTGFSDDINKALQGINGGNAGRRLGQSFNRGFNAGPAVKNLRQLQNEADRAREVFFRLVTTSYFVGPAIAGLVGAIGALAAGFVALSSQILAATPSLIVLPSIFSAIGQAALTAKLAFGGIGKAVQSIGKSTGGSSKNLEGNFERIRNAKRRVESATKTLTKAQDRLNKAYEQAAESLQQLNFDAEDAAIAEKKAAIELERARETLARVQDLPPNSRARREAELAYAEADLNYRRAIDRNKDLAAETEKRNAAGVEGSEEVLSAQEAVENALDQQSEAVRDLARAQKALNDAQSSGAGAAQDAFEGLSKEAIAFAEYLAGLKPKIAELRAAAGRLLFPQLEIAIQNLVDKLFPRLIPILERTGDALGKSAIDFSNIVTEAGNLKNLDIIAETNADTIGKLGTVTGNLYSVFLDLLSAADPLVRRFTDWLVVITDGWRETARARNETGELTGTFERAGDVAAQLGRIFGNIGRALMDIGRAASGPGSGGQMLLDSFENATKKFEEFVTRISEDGSLQQYFRDVVPNVEAIGRLFNEIVVQVLKLGDDKGIAGFADGLTRATEALGGIFGVLNNAGPALGTFIDNLVRFLQTLTESKSIELFFGTLNVALEGLILLFSNPVINKLFMVATAFLGIVKAIMLMNKVAGFGGKVFRGYVQSFERMFLMGQGSMGLLTQSFKMARASGASFGGALKLVGKDFLFLVKNSKIASAVTKVWTGVQKAFNLVMKANPVAKYILIISALIAIVVVMYKKFGWFRDFVHKVWDSIKAAAEATWKAIKVAFDIVWGAIKTGIEFVWNNVIKPIFEAFSTVFEIVWKGIELYFTTYWTIIKTAIELVWNTIIKPIFEAFLTVFQVAWDGISLVFTTVWDGIKSAIEFAWNNVIRPIFNALKSTFEKAWGGIKKVFETTWNGITEAISLGIDGIKGAFSLLQGIVEGVWRAIQKAGETAFKALTGVVQGVLNGIIGAFEFALNVLISAINVAIKAYNAIPFAPNFKPLDPVKLDRLSFAASGGKTLKDVLFPGLAAGGIVPATSGGLLYNIGEAGKPERVEPLDPSGLSKRDRAIIQLLSGGMNGATINVYPSPGMDEVELASLVSRQIAFQLRRGTT